MSALRVLIRWRGRHAPARKGRARSSKPGQRPMVIRVGARQRDRRRVGRCRRSGCGVLSLSCGGRPDSGCWQSRVALPLTAVKIIAEPASVDPFCYIDTLAHYNASAPLPVLFVLPPPPSLSRNANSTLRRTASRRPRTPPPGHTSIDRQTKRQRRQRHTRSTDSRTPTLQRRLPHQDRRHQPTNNRNPNRCLTEEQSTVPLR